MALRHVHQLQPSSINKTFSGGILAGALSDGVSRKMGLGFGPLGTSDVQPFCKAKSRTRIWRFSHFFHSAKVAGVVTNMSTESGVQQANLISPILWRSLTDLPAILHLFREGPVYWQILTALHRMPSLRFWSQGRNRSLESKTRTTQWKPGTLEPGWTWNLYEPQTLYLQLLSLETLQT